MHFIEYAMVWKFVSSHNSYVDILTPKGDVMVWVEGAFGKYLSHEDETQINDISVF